MLPFQGEHSAILSTFIKLPFVIKIFVLSVFKWPLKTGFTVLSPATDNSLLDRTTFNAKSNKAGQLGGSNWRIKLEDQTATQFTVVPVSNFVTQP